MKTQPVFWPKCGREKKRNKNVAALMPAQTRFKSRVKMSKNFITKPEFSTPHRTNLTFHRGSFAHHLLIENELGDGEDIDRFAMLQGVFTPCSSGVRTTVFLDFWYSL